MNLEQLDQPLLGPDEAWTAADWTLVGATAHPVAPLPDAAWLRTHTVNELLTFLGDREKTIALMKEDPFRNGYEPPVWRLLDAICGFPWIDPSEEAIASEPDAAKRAAMRESVAWCLMVRRKLLHQDEPIKTLMLNGGNRAGKSEWAASRVMKLLMLKPNARAWCFHQDASMSRDNQQPLMHKYLPAELRTEKGVRRSTTYIAYKQQTGFSEEKFVLPNRSDCNFRYYEQDASKDEGGEVDIIWGDEKVPASRVNTWRARVATRKGWIIITFTPVGPKGTAAGGYSPTVKMFLDSAILMRESIAFVLPKDGGAPALDLALAGEDVMAWLEDKPSQPAVPAGREFERVKRIMRCPDRRTAVFFFHSFDNAFGTPAELFLQYASTPTVEKRMRFYGVAEKQIGGQFPKFRAMVGVHLFRADQLPKRGTRYHVVDPCSGRNWAQIWALVDRAPIGKRIWIYREWPCPGKYVPGVGDMGTWAEPSDKHDGDRGLAQQPLGWGIERYREEIFRLEGRRDPKAVPAKSAAEPFRFDADDEPEYPPPRYKHGRPRATDDGEDIYERIMDSRYGKAPSQTQEGQTTLLEICAEAGLEFVPASGRDIHEGVDLINSLLDYNEEQPIGPMNGPRLLVSEECQNLIYALQNWTNADGLHGACKDFVDLVRYLVLHDPEDWSEDRENAA